MYNHKMADAENIVGLLERLESLDRALDEPQSNPAVWDVYMHFYARVRDILRTRYIRNSTMNSRYSHGYIYGHDIHSEDWMQFLKDDECWKGLRVQRWVLINDYLQLMSQVIVF